MRELWRAACGALDVPVMTQAFWMSALSQKQLGERELGELHPLRRLELPPLPPKSPELRAAESEAGWKLMRQFFGQKKTKRRG